jgi:hypothetical protein
MRLAAVAAVLVVLRLDDARRGFAKIPGPAAAQDVAAARQQQATSVGLILLGLVRLAFSACRAAVRSAFLLFLAFLFGGSTTVVVVHPPPPSRRGA